MRSPRRFLATAAPLSLSIAILPALSGCHVAIRDQAQVDPIVQSHSALGKFGQPIPVVPNCSVQVWVERAAGTGELSPSCPDSTGLSGVSLKPYEFPGDQPIAVERRTQAQAELMTYADQICDEHVAGIYSKQASTNFNLGLLTMLFSGGAAVATGRTATNLAAESALFSGARTLVNSEVYYGYIGPAVMREIRSLRSDLRAQIVSKRTCSINTYPAQEAINDALIYHDACSFATGLASLLSKAGNTRIGEDKLRVAQLKAMAAQLKSKKAALAAAETELSAMSTADIAGAPGQVLKERAGSLRAEVDRLESVLMFAGVVDPAGEPETVDTTANVEAAKAAVEKRQWELAGALPQEQAAARAKLMAAQTRYDTATARRDNVRKLSGEVEALNAEISRLKAQQLKLKEGDDRNKVVSSLKAKSDEVVRKKQELADNTQVPTTASNNIEFGIQNCAPVKLTTAQ